MNLINVLVSYLILAVVAYTTFNLPLLIVGACIKPRNYRATAWDVLKDIAVLTAVSVCYILVLVTTFGIITNMFNPDILGLSKGEKIAVIITIFALLIVIAHNRIRIYKWLNNKQKQVSIYLNNKIITLIQVDILPLVVIVILRKYILTS